MSLANRINKILFNMFIRPDCRVSLSYYGTEYGGFYVCDRMGKGKGEFIIYSFGIGEDISFSESIMKSIRGCRIYAFDPTPKSEAFVRNHPLFHDDRFRYFKIGLSSRNKTAEFFLPENEEYVSGSEITHSGLKSRGIKVKMRDLKTISRKLGHKHIDLLKMDIEGSEFDVADTLDRMGVRADQICMETHARFFRFGFFKLLKMNSKMHRMGYVLVSKKDDDLTYILRSELVRK